MSHVSLGRPEFVPGTPPGHPDRQIPLCDFSLSVFSLHKLDPSPGLCPQQDNRISIDLFYAGNCLNTISAISPKFETRPLSPSVGNWDLFRGA